MKIAHLIYTEGVSGAEKHLKHLLPGLKAHDIFCEVIIVCPSFCLNSLQKFAEELQQLKIPTYIIVANRGVALSTLKKIYKYLKEKEISVLHSHLLRSDLLATFVKIFFLKKLFIFSTKHGYKESILMDHLNGLKKIKRNLVYLITLFTLNYINQNISISKYISRFYIDLGLTKRYFPVIYHGLNMPCEKNNNKNERDYTKIHPKIIIVGRLETIKGHCYALSAIKIVQNTFEDVELLMLGVGSIQQTLEAQIKKLNLEKNVSFLGFKNNPYQYISDADIIIIPSLAEPFGLVFIEAMGLKTPVVAFDVPAGNEIIEHNETGILVEKGNIEGMALGIIDLLKDNNLRQTIAQNAYKVFTKLYTKETMVANTAIFYKDSLQS